MNPAEIDRDIQSIIDCEEGHPIEPIERLIGAGPAATPPIHKALAEFEGSPDHDLLALVVILGEVRSPDSLPVLAGLLRKPQLGEILMDATAEALGKFGESAIPEVIDLLAAPKERTKFWALGALRRMRSLAAIPHLRSALKDLPEICGVAAVGLADMNDKDSIPDLYNVYAGFPETNIWLPDLRDSIACLSGQLHYPKDSRHGRDWRTRWRRRPGWGWSPELSSLMCAYILWDNYTSGKWKERKLKKDSLEKITTTPKRWNGEEKDRICEKCDEKIIEIAALPVCPEIAYGSTVFQENLLQLCLKDGIKTIPEALDDLDQELLYGDCEWEDLPDGRRDRWLLAQNTYEFLLLDGCRSVEDGIVRMRAIRSGLGARWGLPQEELIDDDLLAMEQFVKSGLGLPKKPSERRAMKVGRNAPCPCGSGHKYKKCCADREQ